MITDVNVREADAADAPELARLRWAFKQEDHDGDPSEPVRPMKHAEDWIRDRLASKRWLAWVAESHGKICGHVFLQTRDRGGEHAARVSRWSTGLVGSNLQAPEGAAALGCPSSLLTVSGRGRHRSGDL
ncbi:hypothetical protein ABZ478_33870 [Streptomyces sp. NPDC005706]|uniref:hypothetical protein n=1 Tax=Streptomyces sp. NPDC005706 TaxID=3157169 RepID=UPI0033ECF542